MDEKQPANIREARPEPECLIQMKKDGACCLVKEFDYDLRTTVESGTKRYWAKVRATGELTEISHEVNHDMYRPGLHV